MMPPQPQWFGERDKGASPFRAANFPNTNTMNVSKEAQEALATMKKTEDNWNKMVNRTVEVSGQFVEDCKQFQKEQREWFLENVQQSVK